jgi:CRISPR/Cas system CMR subunit Cmr6 (Cas7 group RAMP superfamily)
MKYHLKSRFQMFNHKFFNEFIDTDKYFTNQKSIEGYGCANVCFVMTSKMLYVAGMKTESFAEEYLAFIRKYGIPSVLQRDYAKSEMSQRVKDIQSDLIIADQRTEPHSP